MHNNSNKRRAVLQKGCDYKPCEDAVCGCDSYCCEVSWDLSCRGYEKNSSDGNNNAFIEGCSASLLCCDPDAVTEVTTENEVTEVTITGGMSIIFAYQLFPNNWFIQSRRSRTTTMQ